MNKAYNMGGGSGWSNQRNKSIGSDFPRRRHNFEFNPYQNSHSRRRRNRDNINRILAKGRQDENQWFKIMIPFGKKMGKEFILKSIAGMCRAPFTPVNFQFHGNSAVFFVNDYISAIALKDISRKITTPEGYKMNIVMNRSPPPPSNLDAALKETIKTIMSSRYNVDTKQLDLSKFHEDPALKSHGAYAPLQRKNIFDFCVKIIKEHIPDLQSLHFGNNKLYMIEPLSSLVGKCKYLKSLNLCNNKLPAIRELNHIRGIPIEELVLDGNPLCDDYKDQASYISAVRERLPKVYKLDGETLEKPIAFNLEVEEEPPPVMGSFFPSEEVKHLVVQFLEQYFSIYDSSNRQPLIDAYHDQAVFSLSIVKPMRGEQLKPYLPHSRNLVYVTDANLRFRLLNQGRMAIVSLLTKLPSTQHDPSSFIVDVSYVSLQLMSFTVTGVFKESPPANDSQLVVPLRTFSRTFLVVPQGQGFSIINETLLVTNATVEQVKAYKTAAAATSHTIPLPPPVAAAQSPVTADSRQKMILEMCNLSGMNMEYSAKCLLEYDWNLQSALNTFRKLQSEGSIPPQAFQK